MNTCYLCGCRSSGKVHRKCLQARDLSVREQWLREANK